MPMAAKTAFFFYLAALICFLVAAAGEAWKFGRLGRRGVAPRLVLVPLGLALWMFPELWNAFKAGF